MPVGSWNTGRKGWSYCFTTTVRVLFVYFIWTSVWMLSMYSSNWRWNLLIWPLSCLVKSGGAERRPDCATGTRDGVFFYNNRLVLYCLLYNLVSRNMWYYVMQIIKQNEVSHTRYWWYWDKCWEVKYLFLFVALFFQAPHSYGMWSFSTSIVCIPYMYLYLTPSHISYWFWQVMWYNNYWWYHSMLSTRPHASTSLVTSVKVSYHGFDPELPKCTLRIIPDFH